MKKIIQVTFSALTYLLVLSFFVPPAFSAPVLVWSDEFNEDGVLPSERKWAYEVGFVRNEELQYYTNANLKNIRQKGGNLIIEAHKESIENPIYTPGAQNWRFAREYAQWSSASITTKQFQTFDSGRIEIRAKVPTHSGFWPAVWLLGAGFQSSNTPNAHSSNWPAIGEMDILEVNNNPVTTNHSSLHYDGDDGHYHMSTGAKPIDHADGFHIYAVQWDTNSISFSLDGQIFHSVMTDSTVGTNGVSPFTQPMYMIVNLAVNNTGFAGPLDEAVESVQFEVDYIRYFKIE